MEDGKKLVRVFTTSSFESVVSAAILEEVIDDNIELDIQYVNYLDFRDYQKFSDAQVTIILNLAYKGYNLPENFYHTVDNPFSDFLHFCTFGESIKGEYVISDVTEEKEPIKELFSLLTHNPDSSILSEWVKISNKAQQMADAVESYRQWTWEGNNLARVLLALYHANYKRLPKVVRGLELQDIVKKNAPTIKGQLEKMDDYIDKKVKETKTQNIVWNGESYSLNVVFADQYLNELANNIISRDVTGQPVIVCVGSTTRGNDIFRIRTRGVDASHIAYAINQGQGKEFAATVFSEINYSSFMANAIKTALSDDSE